MSAKPRTRNSEVLSKSKLSSATSVTIIKKIFNFVDKEDKGEITYSELCEFIKKNSINDDLIYIKKMFEENSGDLKFADFYRKFKDSQQLCKNYFNLYSNKIEKMNEMLSKILSDLDFSMINIIITINHSNFESNIKKNFEYFEYEGNQGMNFLIDSNLEKSDKIFFKINDKYFNIRTENISVFTISLSSLNQKIMIEIVNGKNPNKFGILLENYLHLFFDGNIISGIISDFNYEIEMKIKESEFDWNNRNYSNQNKVLDFSNNSSSVYEINKNLSFDDNIRKIQKNYSETYYKNNSNIEKYKFYRDILSSVEFDNKKPDLKDLINLDRLFGVSYEENTSNNNLNDSFNDNSRIKGFNKCSSTNKISFSKKIQKDNLNRSFLKNDSNFQEDKSFKTLKKNSSPIPDITLFTQNSKEMSKSRIEETFIDNKLKSLIDFRTKSDNKHEKKLSILNLLNFSIKTNYFLYKSPDFNMVTTFMDSFKKNQ